uniref:H/ACA ribonucleoprotein complex non-core subunit NAF1 n=1 Tax=Rhizophora mucronata TaxID=61149 RepID=A0A2P2QPK4_RHIMU
MVGFMSKPNDIGEDVNPGLSPKSSKFLLYPFDSKTVDLDIDFADKFLDFDSIKEYFEDNREKADFGKVDMEGFEKKMGVDDKGSCAEDCVRDPNPGGSNPVREESKPLEDGPGCVVKEEEMEFDRDGVSGCFIEEVMGRVSLVGGSNRVIGDGIALRSEVEEEKGNVCLVTQSSSVASDWSNLKNVVEDDGVKTGNESLATVSSSIIAVKSETMIAEDGKGSLSFATKSSSVLHDGCNVKNEVVNDGVRTGHDSLEARSSSVVGIVSSVNSMGMRNRDASESDTESESLSSSSSSSSPSSSSGDDEEMDVEEYKKKEDDNKKEELRTEGETNLVEDIEEGEITETNGEEIVGGIGDSCGKEEEEEDGDVDKMVDWSDADFDDVEVEDGGIVRGPIRSKNELTVLPPVPPVDITLHPHHQLMPVGVILSIMGAQVVVEGMEKHNPLNEGSILWVTETRSPLGLVDEIFGPVRNPFYVVRYNSENDIPRGIHEGSFVCFVPEFVNHVLNDKELYKKGYDASGENDEEVSDEEEFSDDEKEAEYKRMQKMSKRGMTEQTVKNQKTNRKNIKIGGGNWKKNKYPGQQTVMGVDQPSLHQKQPNVFPVRPVLGPNINPPSSAGKDFTDVTGFVPPFPPMPQTSPVFPVPNLVWANGVSPQQPQSTVIPGGLLGNNMPLATGAQVQHPCQMPVPNCLPFQQQFNLNPNQASNPITFLSSGQPNLVAGPLYSTLLAALGQNSSNLTSFGMGLHVQPPLRTMNTSNGGLGMLSSGQCVEQNSNMQPPTVIPSDIQATQVVNLGASSSRGRRPHHRGRGRFAHGRGRHASK